MSVAVAPCRPAATYPTAHVRGRRISRNEEKTLEWSILNAETAEFLGQEQIGWFVGGHPGTPRVAEQLGRLDGNPAGGIWVVVPLGREHSHELFAHWPHQARVARGPRDNCSWWRSRKVWVAMPEDLKHLLPLAHELDSGVAGVIVLDPPCIIHQARRGTDWRGRRHTNDRPQHVVNFRASLGFEGWQPPLLFLTDHHAKAVNTEAIARTFCLNAFHFIAGDSFACWEDPIDSD